MDLALRLGLRGANAKPEHVEAGAAPQSAVGTGARRKLTHTFTSQLQDERAGPMAPSADDTSRSDSEDTDSDIINDRSSLKRSSAHEQDSSQQRRKLTHRLKLAKPETSFEARLTRIVWRTALVLSVVLLVNLLVYYWPSDGMPALDFRRAANRPRPRFTGPLAINEHLLGAEQLFAGQFHAPESMAWRSDKRAFYTGVEGGFILLVEPADERWQVVARLNARHSVRDVSRAVKFELTSGAARSNALDLFDQLVSNTSTTASPEATLADATGAQSAQQDLFAPFCARDIELYGRRAEFEPRLVSLSRCSRPLGIRLAPNDSYLYVSDPLSGLYRVDLAADSSEQGAAKQQALVTKLVDFAQFQAPDGVGPHADAANRQQQVLFADDIAVDWSTNNSTGDIIYLTDCSTVWPLRYLFWLMLTNDDSGRVLQFDTESRVLSQLRAIGAPAVPGPHAGDLGPVLDADWRNLSFPNGLELSANRSALLVSDLNNRRILMHHLRGPLAGTTQHLLWVPGYSDNIRRGLDAPDGRATYWTACGCAVDDGRFELAEYSNDKFWMRRWLLKWLQVLGSGLAGAGHLFASTSLKDAGVVVGSAWLKVDPYCRHGLALQFSEDGQVLRSLHAPAFDANFKILSEAHEVPGAASGLDKHHHSQNSNASAPASTLYLGSVYYSYLGRLELEALRL